MDYIENINRERIRWCCDDRGITLDELREHVGIAASTWEKFIEGERGLTFKQLRGIANYFNRGVLFFLETGPVNERRLRSPQFRTIANQREDLSSEIKAIIERVERHRELYLGLLEDLDEAAPFDPPEMPVRNLKPAAQVAREWLGLNGEDNFSAYRAAVERRGVLVFQSMGYQGQWRLPAKSSVAGFSLYFEQCPVIFIKKLEPKTRQTFTLMHELGHLLLHRSSFIDDEDDLFSREGRERMANAFAGCLLVPDEHLDQINVDARPDHVSGFSTWLRPYTRAWGISAEVILRRLLDCDRLPREEYEAYRERWRQQPASRQEEGNRQWRNREPLHIFGGRFVRTVLDALHARQITLNKASAYLDNLKVKDVHALEAHLADV